MAESTPRSDNQGGRLRSMAITGMLAATLLISLACSTEPGGGANPDACSKIVEHSLIPPGTWGSKATVSADGRRVAFIRDGRVIVRETTDGTEHDITGDLAIGLPLGSLRISTDGTKVGVTLPGIVRADREGYIIDVATGTAQRLAWPEAQWASGVEGIGFSGDLSAFVFRQSGTTTYWVVPSDGSPNRQVELDSYGGERMDEDASVLASGTSIVVDGTRYTYEGPDADTATIVDIDRSGFRTLLTSAGRAYYWYPTTGVVEALPLAPGETASDGGWARSSDDGRFIIRGGQTIDGDWGVWRFDRVTGSTVALPLIFDNVTGVSDNGRVFTSTNASYFACID